MHPTGNPNLAEWLVAKGLMSSEQRNQALSHQQLMGGRIEEAIIDAGALPEADLLKFLAGVYRTHFVSTEKLAKVQIERGTLEKVPRKLAEEYTAFPVTFDAPSSTLGVVIADPDDTHALRQVQLAARCKHVKAFVARPLAIKAAIAKSYCGDSSAFARLEHASLYPRFTSMLDMLVGSVVSQESGAPPLPETPPRERASAERPAPAANAERTASGADDPLVLDAPSYLATLEVLVSLLESARSELRGHAAHVARLMTQLGERIGLPPAQITALAIAGHLHDLGKMGEHHLTALNAGVSSTQRSRAEQGYAAPCRLLEAVSLPPETVEAIESMYERFGGDGLPGQRSGKDIPLGARLLAIADTYADLTRNPKNPFSKTLSSDEACSVLMRYAPSLFDPNLVELFKHAMTGSSVEARLSSKRHLALLVDTDPEETTVLELRLIEHGFEVRVARSAPAALEQLRRGDIDIVVSELELGAHDGLSLLEQARQEPWGKQLPWVILTQRTSRQDADRAFGLGADDFVTKPASGDLLVTKLEQIIDRRGRSGAVRGVSGSLTEMGLPEIVQVLCHGRKTGALKIVAAESSGEIHFVDGQIYNALFGNKRGAAAFYAMVVLSAGEFALDSGFVAPERMIEESPEGLLLEGMRRLDEGITQ